VELVLGMKDIYPKEARLRRHMTESLSRLFEQWGYEPVEPPTMEYAHVLEKIIGEEIKERLYQFVNREGKVVCLRPEFTTSVARMLSRGNPTLFPLRVYYAGRIFRYPSSPFHTESELTQIGVENIGSPSVQGDGEVIALAISSLKRVGVEEFRVDIGHVGIFRHLLTSLPLQEEAKQTVKRLVKQRDFVALQNFWEATNLTHHPVTHIFLRFPFLRGKREVLEEAETLFPHPEWHRTLHYLSELWTKLSDFGYEEYLTINLGLIRDFDYYSGVIWEGFSPHLGYPLLAGGRYDELFQILGKDLPACGFALFLERLVQVLKQPQGNIPEKIHLFYPSKGRREAFQLAEKLREQGYTVVIEEKEQSDFTFSTSKKTIRFFSVETEKIEELLKELRT